MVARVNLDEDALGKRIGVNRGRQMAGARDRVDADPEGRRGVVECPDSRSLRADRPDRIREEDFLDPGGGENLGLADGPDADPTCARVQLKPSDLNALVRLGMWAERDPAPVHLALKTSDVRVHAVEVDDDLRRVEGGWQRWKGQIGGRARSCLAHGGRSTMAFRISPSRSTRNVTSSPGCR